MNNAHLTGLEEAEKEAKILGDGISNAKGIVKDVQKLESCIGKRVDDIIKNAQEKYNALDKASESIEKVASKIAEAR